MVFNVRDRANAARQPDLAVLHSVFYGVPNASLDRINRFRNQRQESAQRRLCAALPRVFRSVCWLPFRPDLLSLLLNADDSLSALDLVKEGIAYVAENASTSQVTLGVGPNRSAHA